MTCIRCGRADQAPRGPLTLHLWSPLGHSAAKIGQIAGRAGLRARETAETGAVALDVDDDSWAALEPMLIDGLSNVEREAIRLIAAERGVAPRLADIGRVVTLDQHIGRLRSAWLIARLADEALAVGLEPVAHADAPDEIFAHFAHLSAEDDAGRRVGPAEVFEAARSADFLAALDRTARLTAIRSIADSAVEGPVFVTFAPSAIYDPRYCLRTTVAEAEKRGVRKEALVFSVHSADAGADVAHLDTVLRYYVEHGFRTAMTLSNRREASFDMLQRLKPDVLILDPSLIVGVRTDPHREVVARKLIEIAHRLQIDTLVQGVDAAEDCEWAYGQGASYVQGAHVAAAAAAAPAAPAAALQPAR
jgi:EAL domain-containing protein (putative c-di-GMP-specific phosphodiesterase class I)